MAQNSSQQYDFPIEIRPINADGIVIPERYAVIRTDTDKPLGIISDRYKLVPHKEVVERSRAALIEARTNFKELITTTGYGAHLWIIFNFPDIKIEIWKGDPVTMQVIVENSYDTSTSIRFSIGAFRVVCSNGIVVWKRFVHDYQRHIPRLDIGSLQDRFGSLTRHFYDEAIPLMKRMPRTRVSMKTIDQLFKRYEEKNVFPKWMISDAQIRYQKESKNVWNFYNALTFSLTHGSGGMNIETQTFYARRAWVEANKLLRNPGGRI